MSVDIALRELSRFQPTQALAILDKLEEKRRKEQFVKYWEPQPQQASNLTRFTQQKKLFALLGGNRSGKTDEGAFLATAFALGKDCFRDEPTWEIVKDLPIKEPPNNIWVVGLDSNVLRDVIWREKFFGGRNHPPFVPQDALERRVDNEYQMTFHNGSVITGKSADSGRAKFQGAEVDLVWIDEECEADIFDESYQRTASGGKILLTLTPLTDVSSGVRTPWVYDLYEKFLAGQSDLQFEFLSVLDNPYIPEEEKARLLTKWANDPEGQARLYGKFFQRSGLVYYMWDAPTHLVKPFRISSTWLRVACIDPAPTGITACLWCAVAPNNDLYFYREYYEADKVVSEHAKNIRVRAAGEPVDIWLIDPKGGSQRNAETHKTIAQLYRDAGIPVRLAEVDDTYGLDASREYMAASVTPNARHPKAFFFDNLASFRYEVERYVWARFARGEQKGLSKEKPVKRFDHLLNCFQYISAQHPRARRVHAYNPEAVKEASRLNSYT